MPRPAIGLKKIMIVMDIQKQIDGQGQTMMMTHSSTQMRS